MSMVTFWLNAFIPKTVAGYTQVIPAGPHKGKTAVPLPGLARLWVGNTFKDVKAGYLTDQRGFDPAPGASCRMQSIAQIDVTTLTLAKSTHRSSGTTEVNLSTGTQTGFAVADMSRCSFAVVPSGARTAPPGGGVGLFAGHTSAGRGGVAFPLARPKPATSYGTIEIKLVGQAGDPLVGMAADIDYVGTFAVTTAPGSVEVRFNGKIDAFPAYDCYAHFNGVTKTLFTSSPPAGNTVSNLLGGASRPVSGVATF